VEDSNTQAKSVNKYLKIFGALFILLTLFFSVSVFLAYKYEDEVRDIVVYEVNRNLKVPVSVQDINFSLLQRFPYASLRFSHVVVPMTSRPDDTLLYINDLYLQIGLLDFLRKQYKITEADAIEGFFKMELYADGTDNYHFWQSNADSSGAAELELTNVQLKGISYSLLGSDDYSLDLFINKASANGEFGSVAHTINTEVDITEINHISEGKPMFKDASPSGKIDVLVSEAGYKLNTPGIKVCKEIFTVDGTFTTGEKSGWELTLSTTEARIENIIAASPLTLQSAFGAYRAEGETDLVVEMKSVHNKPFSLDVVFDRTNGSFRHEVAMGKAKIADASGSVQIRNGITSLYLDALKAGIGPGNVEVSGKVINFDSPVFDLNLNGLIDLGELRDLFNIESLEKMDGELSLKGKLSGKLSGGSNNETLALLKAIDFAGDIQLKDGSFKLKEQSQTFDLINGDIALRNNNLLVNDATARVNGNPFGFSGAMQNALPYLTSSDQKLHIKANFSAKTLDLNEILATETSQRDTSYRVELPTDITFDLGVNVEKIIFRKFTALEAHGRAYYTNGLLTLNPVQFRTAGGSVQSSISLQQKSGKAYETTAKAALQGLALNELFSQFEDFGQQVIRSTHISGKTDAYITFGCTMGSDLQIDNKSIKALAEVTVLKGKLKNLEALQGIPDYLRQNALWKSLVKVNEFERKLKEIEFDTLKNTIKIENSVVTIPYMTVRSSAMTINLAGTHHFDNRINYALNFRLSDLLRTGKKNNEEFGYIVDDNTGLRLFMLMTGTVDNPIFDLDKDAAKQKRKMDFEQEKSTMKNILKEEFGLFKNDPSLTGVPQPKARTESQISVEWDDFGSKPDTVITSEPKKKTPPKKGKPSKADEDLYDKLEKDDDL
jgi:hypothetical protein